MLNKKHDTKNNINVIPFDKVLEQKNIVKDIKNFKQKGGKIKKIPVLEREQQVASAKNKFLADRESMARKLNNKKHAKSLL